MVIACRAGQGSRILVVNGHEPTDNNKSPVTLWSTSMSILRDERVVDKNHMGSEIYLSYLCARAPNMAAKDVVAWLASQLLTTSRQSLPVPEFEFLDSSEQVREQKKNELLQFPNMLDELVKLIHEQLKHTKCMGYP